MSLVLNGTDGVTFNDSSLQGAAASPYVLKNRIINGDMRIDQRNAGASVSISNNTLYSVDRFPITSVCDGSITAQQSSVAPDGFTKSILITVASADASIGATQYNFIRHIIEGFNSSDLYFGAATAKTITISFWVRSSVTGTFGGALQNATEARAYAFTYTINVANTWEQKTITVTGDTSGTWNTTNGAGLIINWSLGTGTTYSSTANSWVSQTSFSATGANALLNTNGATFYITGVQLEQNTVATPFERRLYSQELANCQRYYYKVLPTINARFGTGYNKTTIQSGAVTFFPVSMRIAPTSVEQTGTAADYGVGNLNTGTVCNAVPTFIIANQSSAETAFNTAAVLTAGQGSLGYAVTSTSYLAWSAEL